MADDLNFDFGNWGLDTSSTDAPSTDTPSTTPPAAATPAAEDPVNKYLPTIWESFSKLASDSPSVSSIFGPSITDTGTVGTNNSPDSNSASADQSFMDKFRSFLGFTDNDAGKNEAGKLAGAGAIAVGSGLISGAGKAYSEAQNRKIAQQNADSQRKLIDSQVALNAAKTHQNLAGLKVNPGGMINAPYKPAPITPVATRA